MSKRAIIVHRWGSSPAADWYPWLRRELEARGYNVVVPAMPDSDEPTILTWTQTLASILQQRTADNGVLVGHSIGCQTIPRTLANLDVRVEKALFVAGWVELTGLENDELSIAGPWLHEPFDTVKAASRIGSSVALFSSDDPLVPYSIRCFSRTKLIRKY